MNRVNLVLLAALVACAIGVITAQHRTRKLFIELENAQGEARRLEEEFTQLQLEQGTWSTHKRIEAEASRNLGMRLPDPGSTRVIELDARKAVAP